MSSTPSAAEVSALERVAYDLWVAPETERLDGWVLRFAHGLTGRANSVWPNEDGALPLDEKVAAAEAWYAARGLPTRFQVTDASRPDGLEQELLRRGYGLAGVPTSVETSELVSTRHEPGVKLADEADEAWLGVWLAQRGAGATETALRLLTGSPGRTVFARIGDVAVGRAVAVGDWLGVTSMATAPAVRRQGHGRAILSSLIAWGRAVGCSRGILQVESNNAAARALYASFGFRQSYEYRYLVPQEPGSVEPNQVRELRP